MRAIVLSFVALLGMGSLVCAQDRPGALRGVYGPPGLTPPAKSGKSTLSAPDYGAVGNGPRVTVSGEPTQGQTLPSSVTPAPIPDRPGYGTAIVNGKRAIIDMTNNRIVQVLD
ncbi:MAG: DUF1236 domain-containing protein [Roseiarcus sp.]